MLAPKWQRRMASEILLSKHLSETGQFCQGPHSRGKSLLLHICASDTATGIYTAGLHLPFNALSEFEALLNIISREKYFLVKFHLPKKRKLKKSEEKLIQFHIFTSLQSLASSCHKFISLQKAAQDTSYILNQSQTQHKLPFIYLEYRLVASSATVSYHAKLLILFNLKQYKKLTKLQKKGTMFSEEQFK